MPWAPKTICTYPGCSALVDGGRCDKHKRQERRLEWKRQDEQRGNSASRGYGERWRKLRIQVLNAEPLCRICAREGRTTGATVVDHIIPHKGNSELLYSRENLQPLCKRHHDIKTALKDGRWG